MKLGRNCEWKDININEVFVVNIDNDCDIFIKLNKNKAMLLADDYSSFPYGARFIGIMHYTHKYFKDIILAPIRECGNVKIYDTTYETSYIYKLSKATQRLWVDV